MHSGVSIRAAADEPTSDLQAIADRVEAEELRGEFTDAAHALGCP
jgi:hypothetical protein